jgi:diguanylate cyclase (GGDEF)-like protein
MFLDLDNFKPVNDAYGHEIGDLLLAQAAARLSSCVREIDTVARFGGDEFVILLNTLATDKSESVERATLVAEKIRTALLTPYDLRVGADKVAAAQVEHRCTGSIGVVLFLGHASIPGVLLKAADAAMYQAKKRGRNQVFFFMESP